MFRRELVLAISLSMAGFGSPASADWAADVKSFAELTGKNAYRDAANVAERLLKYDGSAMPLTAVEREEFLRKAADTMLRARNFRRAAELYNQLISNIEKREGEKSFHLFDPLRQLAEVLARAGDLDRSAQLYERALGVLQAEAGQSSPLARPLLDAYRAVERRRLRAASKTPDIAAKIRQNIERLRLQADTLALVEKARSTATRIPRADFQKMRGENPGAAFQLVRVFYGTNREPSGNKEPDRFYGDRRGALQLGIATVSVPKDRRPGEIPLPSLWQGDLRPNQAKHFIFTRLQVTKSADEFTSAAREQVQASTRKEAVVFVHGYNTDFRGAVFRAAQLAVDLEVDGAMFMYSWPSKASIVGYVADGAGVVRPVARSLSSFLKMVAEKSGAERIHVVAHSMGNRYLLEALELMARDITSDKRTPLFQELVFAAPDVDAEDFSDRVSSLGWFAHRKTLYASSKDRALYLSSLVNGGYRRAGDASAIVVVKGLDTVDTTQAGGEGLGHGDFANAALDDFKAVVWLSLQPDARCELVDRKLPAGAIYWLLANENLDHCPQAEFRRVISIIRRLGRAEAPKYVMGRIEAARARADQASVAQYQKLFDLMKKLL